MPAKELYASVQFAQDELRIVVGEYFMSRLNVLKTLRIKMEGMKNSNIVDSDSVSAALVRGFDEIEKTIGYKIKDVIINIPSDQIKCIKRRISVPIAEGSKRIRLSHAKLGISKILESFNSDEYEFVNIGSIKYINGGITSRTLPIDEQAEALTMDVDLLLAPKELVYSYVSTVEKSGLKVLDICLDSYAVAEESAILESSMSQYVVLNNFEKEATTVTLFYKGSVVGSEKINYGYDKMIQKIKLKYRLNDAESAKLLKDLSLYGENELNDSIVFMYAEHGIRHEITRKQLYETIEGELNKWINDVNELNQPIIDSGPTKMVISGSGADIVGLKEIVSDDCFNCETSVYIPDSVGIRKGLYSVALGAIYAHKKWSELLESGSCQYEQKTSFHSEIKRDEDNAFTKKLKSILLNK